MESFTYIKNVFKNGSLTTENYTRAWVAFITASERQKAVYYPKKA